MEVEASVLSESSKRLNFMDKILPNLEELLQFALSLTKDGRAAAALMGEAMAEAYSSWDGSMRDEGCKMWLHKIVTRRFFKSGRRQMNPLLPVLYECVNEGHPDSNRFTKSMTDIARGNSSPIGESAEDAKYFEAIASLPAGFRSAMILSCFERFSHREISDLTGVEPHGIKLWLDRGRSLLGEELFPHLMGNAGLDSAPRGEVGSA